MGFRVRRSNEEEQTTRRLIKGNIIFPIGIEMSHAIPMWLLLGNGEIPKELIISFDTNEPSFLPFIAEEHEKLGIK